MVGQFPHLLSNVHQQQDQKSVTESRVIDEINDQVKHHLRGPNKKVVIVSNKKVQTICNSAALKAAIFNPPYQYKDSKGNILRIVINGSEKELNCSCTSEMSADVEEYSMSCQDTFCETFDSSFGLLETGAKGKFKNDIKDNNSLDDGFENFYRKESSVGTVTLTHEAEESTTVSREAKKGLIQRMYRLCAHKGQPHEISNNAVTSSSGSVNNRRNIRKNKSESVKKRMPNDVDINSSPNSSGILSGSSDSVDGDLFLTYPIHSPWGPPHKSYPYLHDALNIANMQHNLHLNINQDLWEPQCLNNVEHRDTCLIPTHAERSECQYHHPRLSEGEKSKLNIDPNNDSSFLALTKNSKDGHRNDHESNSASSVHLNDKKETCRNTSEDDPCPPIMPKDGKGDVSCCQLQNQCHTPYTVPAECSHYCPLPLPLHDFLRNPAYRFLPFTSPSPYHVSNTTNTTGMQKDHPLNSYPQPLSVFQNYLNNCIQVSRENAQSRPLAKSIIQQNGNDNSRLNSSFSDDESRSKMTGVRQRPFIICYICGREFGTASIAIHEKQCLDKWRKVNSQLPKKEQRPEPVKPLLNVSLAQDGRTGPTEEDLAIFNEAARDTFQQQYLTCDKCGRTFIPESLKLHVQGCRGFQKIITIRNEDTSLTF